MFHINIVEYEDVAMINPQDKERELLGKCIGELNESWAALEQIDAEVSPLVSVLDTDTVLREDISEKILSREELLKNAPEQYEGYFKVPETL